MTFVFFMDSMAPVSLPDSFASSYHHFDEFPHNLVSREVYGSQCLRALLKRLVSRAPDLLETDAETFVSVKDVLSNGVAKKANLKSDAEVKRWLGDDSTIDPLDSTRRVGCLATREDPSCRFM